MSQLDVQWWSLVVGLGVFAAIVVAAFVRRRLNERREGASAASSALATADSATGSRAGRSDSAATSPAVRSRAESPPPPGEPRELASAIRSSILRAVAERVPAGWTALILSPPPHPERMTWHVHLVPEVALDLRDGRTVLAAPPTASHDWQLPAGRIIGVAEGDPDPAPGDETVTVRVTGPYLVVVVGQDGGQPHLLVARVVLAAGDELPQPRAVPTDLRAVQGALREAIELAVGSRMTGSAPTVGYPLASWSAHERSWLTIGR